MNKNYKNNNIDNLTLTRIEKMHPSIKESLKKDYLEICSLLPDNIMLRFSDTMRDEKTQNKLYEQGRTTKGKIITNAKFGYSYHNFGLAFDVCFLIDNDYNGSYETLKFGYDEKSIIVVNFFKIKGYNWGGNFRSLIDMPHFERKIKETLQILRQSKTTYPTVTLI